MVNPVNDNPEAVNDQYTILEGSTLNLTFADLLSNDTDAEGDTLDVINFVASNGSLTLNPNGFSYTHNGGENTSDFFTYQISDGNNGTDTGTVFLTIDPVNDAPILDNSGDLVLNDVMEDDAGPVGQTVASILASDGGGIISDVDAGSVEGIAVTSVDNSNGDWEYSLDGTTWTSFGATSATESVLLDPAALIRFVPAADYDGSATFSFVAWDQTAGASGDTLVDTTGGSASSAFSSQVEDATIQVTPVNDAPQFFDHGFSTEDSTFNGSAENVFTGRDVHFADNRIVVDTNQTYDLNATIFATDSAGGPSPPDVFQFLGFSSYDIDGFRIATNQVSRHVGSQDTTLAVSLIPGATEIVLSDASGWYDGGAARTEHARSFAWYGYTDSTGNTYDDYTYTRNVESDLWDAGAINGNVITLRDPWTGPTITAGSAVRNATSGSTYNYGLLSREAVSDVPTQVQSTIGGGESSGEISETLFRPGTHSIETVVLSNFTPFGDPIDTDSLFYVSNFELNTTAGPYVEGFTSFTENEGPISILDSDATITDVDDLYIESVTVELTNGKAGDILYVDEAAIGAFGISVSGIQTSPLTTDGSVFLTLTADSLESVTRQDFASAVANIEFESIGEAIDSTDRVVTFVANDGELDSAPNILTIRVFNVNDAPILDNSGDLVLNDVMEDDAGPVGQTVASILASDGGGIISDVDAGSVEGIAVTSVDNSNGDWEYSLDGTTWTSFGATSATESVLLDPAALIRFVPAADYDGSATFSFVAWDQTAGASGDTLVDTTGGSASSAFSSQVEDATIQVTPVNDAPVLNDDLTVPVVLEGMGSLVFDVASVTDIDSPNFDGGSLTVGVTSSPDSNFGLSLSNVGGVTHSLDQVLVGGVVVGNISGGGVIPPEGLQQLSINFITNATASDVQAVLQSVEIFNQSENPIVGLRTVEAVVFDGDGGVSNTLQQNVAFAAVNDEEQIVTNTGLTLDEGGSVQLTTASLNTTDVDNTADEIVYTISADATNGAVLRNGVQLNFNDTFTQADLDAGLISYQHDGSEVLTDSFGFVVDDGNNIFSSGTFSFNINPVNDAPVLDNSIDITLASVAEDDSNSAGQTVGAILISNGLDQITDADNTALEGIAVIGVDNSNGTWEYSTDGGATWLSFAANGVSTSTPDSSDAVVLDTLASIRFVPDADYFGDAGELVFRAWDQTDLNLSGATGIDASFGGGSSAFSTATHTLSGFVDPVNDSPLVTNNFTAVVAEGGQVTIDSTLLFGSDVDDLSAGLTINVTSAPSNGQLERVSNPGMAITSFTQADVNNGQIVYVHNSSETNSDSFGFEIVDGGEDGSTPATGVFDIDVTPTNDAPVVTANDIDVVEGEATQLSLTQLAATDIDNLDGAITLVVQNLSGGHFELISNPGVPVTSFTVDQINSGEVQLVDDGDEQAPSYEVYATDGTDSSNPVAANVNFTHVNDEQVLANNVPLSLNEGSTRVIGAAELLTTDVDNTDIELVYTVTQPTANGFLQLATNPGVAVTTFTQQDVNNGLLSYVHDGSEASDQQFDFLVNDGQGAITLGTFSFQIDEVNDAPTVGSGTAPVVDEGGIVTFSPTNFAIVDVDNNAMDVLVDITAGPNSGFVALAADPGTAINNFTLQDLNDGVVVYVHNGSEVISDQFEFSVSDGQSTVSGFVRDIDVMPVNDAPTASDDLFTVNEDTVLNSGTTIDQNDTDVDGDALTVSLVSGPTNADSFVLNPDGSFVYLPQENFAGSDSFTYLVTDGNGGSDTAIVEIEVQPVNDVPVGTEDSFTLLSGEVFVELTGVLDNDIDVENDPLTAVLVSPPSNGVVLLNGDGTFQYIPFNGFIGTDSFTYFANDGHSNSVPVTVTLNSVATADEVNIVEDSEEESPESQESTAVSELLTEDRNEASGNDSEEKEKLVTIAPEQLILERRTPDFDTDNSFTEFSFDFNQNRRYLFDLIGDRRNAEQIFEFLLDENNSRRNHDGQLGLDGAQGITSFFDVRTLANQLMLDDDEKLAEILGVDITLGTVTVASTAGFVLWSLRGGLLLATALSKAPTWASIDPLPMLDSYPTKAKDDTELEGMFQNND